MLNLLRVQHGRTSMYQDRRAGLRTPRNNVAVGVEGAGGKATRVDASGRTCQQLVQKRVAAAHAALGPVLEALRGLWGWRCGW